MYHEPNRCLPTTSPGLKKEGRSRSRMGLGVGVGGAGDQGEA